MLLDGTPGGNRTHNGPLGGGCYIHLTTEVFDVMKTEKPRFSPYPDEIPKTLAFPPAFSETV